MRVTVVLVTAAPAAAQVREGMGFHAAVKKPLEIDEFVRTGDGSAHREPTAGGHRDSAVIAGAALEGTALCRSPGTITDATFSIGDLPQSGICTVSHPFATS